MTYRQFQMIGLLIQNRYTPEEDALKFNQLIFGSICIKSHGWVEYSAGKGLLRHG